MAENVVAEYGWSSAEGPHSCGYLVPRVLSILEALGVKRVLDIGSGNGVLCAQLNRAGFGTVGMEYDATGVAVASKAYPDRRFYRFGVQDDPALLLATEERFDAVVSTEVIEHLFAPHLLPVYAHKVLNENGYLVVTTPYHGYVKNLALALLGKWDAHHTTLWHGGHIKFFSRATLSALLAEHGFRVIDFAGVGRFPFLWKSMVLVCRRAQAA